MAEALFQKMIEEAGKKAKEIQVVSAGTAVIQGQPPSKNAVEVLREKKIDITGHRAAPLTKELIQRADLILTMTRNHKEQVIKLAPWAKVKTYTLKEYGSPLEEKKDILDPFGQPLWVYQECAKEIEEALKSVLKELIC